MSELEKSFTKLRWKQEIETRQEIETNSSLTTIECDNNDTPENIFTNFYNPSTKCFNLTNVPATSVPFNKRVMMPMYAEESTEAKIAFARLEIEKCVEEHAKLSKGGENITQEQQRGIKELKRRCKEQEIITYPTDKSGRLSVDTKENYINSMDDHLKDVQIVTIEVYEEKEKLMNAYMKCWFRALNVKTRLANNYQSTNNEVPRLYGSRKDHKVFDDDIIGPPTRPVCGAVTASNYRMSHFLTQLIKPLI